MMKWLEGKKTYIVLAVALILGGVDAWNTACLDAVDISWCKQLAVPSWVFSVLAAMGIWTRSVAKPKP